MLMNRHESRTPGVIFTGFWRYKPAHGAVGTLLLGAAGILMAQLLLIFFQDDVISPERGRQAALLGLLSLSMFYFGSKLFFSLITEVSIRLTVSEEGVRYGGRYFPWSRVRWIDARLRGAHLQVVLELRGGLLRTRWLVIDDGLAEEQWERLSGELCKRAQPRYPHLRVGDVTIDAVAETSELAEETTVSPDPS